MPRTLLTVHFSLIVSFIFLLSSCTSPQPLVTSLLVYRFDPPAFLEFTDDFQLTKEIPFHIPPSCGLYNTFPSPQGPYLLIELNCPNGQTVLFLDVETASVSQPITNTDAHFLAWTADGKSAYLKTDSLGSPHVIRVDTDGSRDVLAITEFTYDLAAKPDSKDFIFTLSRGLGYGSELHLANANGQSTQLLYSDQYNYIAFARYSPDGNQIAFIKIPDTQTPFTVGELWVIPATRPSTADFANNVSSSAQGGSFLAYADTGHGYAANWSPDGTRIAFVVRENPEDENANTSSEALISNIYIVDVNTGTLTQVTHLTDGRTETPHWSPDGNTLAFNVVINGRMTMSIADVDSVEVGSSNPMSVEIKDIVTGSACCPAWMRK